MICFYDNIWIRGSNCLLCIMKTETVVRCVRRKKLRAINEFGGKCQKCGYDKCITALEFHHLDEKNKSTTPSHAIMRWSWEKALKELKKCILVCANCHREIHENERGIGDISLKRDNPALMEKECKCCKKKFIATKSRQIMCSNDCRTLFGRKVKRPTKNKLKQELRSNKSWSELGRNYGVSDNAVRKWAKTYGLTR